MQEHSKEVDTYMRIGQEEEEAASCTPRPADSQALAAVPGPVLLLVTVSDGAALRQVSCMIQGQQHATWTPPSQ